MSDDPMLFRVAQAIYPLLHQDAGYQASTKPPDAFGAFADVVQTLRDVHQLAAQLSAKNGKQYDAWADARTAWEGLRASDDGSKQYGLLDRELQRLASALERDPPPAAPPVATNGTKPKTDYTTTPTKPIDSNDLLAMERHPVKWFAPSFLREGLGLLVGLPQVGKTPLAIQLALSIATGTKWMGHVQCRKARVLYLGVEYTAQELIPLLDISRCGMTIPRGMLIFKTMEDEFPRETEAALDDLEWYIRVLEVEVIIIDVLTAFLPPEKFKQSIYRGDYTELKPYHRLASLHHAAILGTWHGSKREVDPRLMYNGSVGMWAVPASRMALYTDQENRVRLSSFPRMCDRLDWALTQEKTNNGRRWVVADAAPEPMCSPTELQIYRFLKQSADKTKPLGPSTITEMTAIPLNTVKGSVRRMFEQNMIQQLGTGYYIEPATDITLVTDVTDTTDVTFVSDNGYNDSPHSDNINSPGYKGYTDQQVAPISSPLDVFPPSLRMTMRMMLVSDAERNITQAKERCEEYGLDYETLRAWVKEQIRNEKE
jgi:hypothetical protein